MKKHVLSALAILAFASHAIAQSVDNAQLREDLISKLPNAERSLKNIYVESHLKNEQWDETKKAWEDYGHSELTAWYDGVIRGRARLDYHPQVVRWIQGAAPFNTTNWSIAWNGTYGQKRYFHMDEDGTLLESTSGELYCERPKSQMEFGRTESGLAFTMWGWEESTGHTISNLLGAKSTGPVSVTVDEAAFESIPCIRVTFGFRHQTEIHFLDPKHGYALRGFERKNGGDLRERIVVQDLMEAAPGLYYPKAATREIFRGPGVPWVRSTLTVQKAVINDPAFDDKVFDLKWPAGASIYEGRTQKSVRMTGDFEKDNAILLAAAQKAARVPATGPAR